jgi:hypothetical protein
MERIHREKLFNFAALCWWIIASLVFAAYVFVEYGQDFPDYYAAARVLLNRGNPYDYVQVAHVMIDTVGWADYNPFFYPPWFAWFITPFATLPYQIARVVWMIFNSALWIFGLLRMQQIIDFPTKGWRRWLVYLLVTFLFAWTTWKFEQAGILLFVLMIEILISFKKAQWNRMGIFMALVLFKPNVMFLPITALMLWLILHKKWLPVRNAFIALLFLVVVTTILTPDWYRPFLRPNFGIGLTGIQANPGQVTSVRINTTLLDWLKWSSAPVTLRYGIYLVVVLTALFVLWRIIRTSSSILEVTAIALLTSYAITPYALQYDFPPLVLVLLWALAESRKVKAKIVPVLIVIFLSSVLIWERPISDGYWIVIGLIVLTVWMERAVKGAAVSEQSVSRSQ